MDPFAFGLISPLFYYWWKNEWYVDVSLKGTYLTKKNHDCIGFILLYFKSGQIIPCQRWTIPSLFETDLCLCHFFSQLSLISLWVSVHSVSDFCYYSPEIYLINRILLFHSKLENFHAKTCKLLTFFIRRLINPRVMKPHPSFSPTPLKAGKQHCSIPTLKS